MLEPLKCTGPTRGTKKLPVLRNPRGRRGEPARNISRKKKRGYARDPIRGVRVTITRSGLNWGNPSTRRSSPSSEKENSVRQTNSSFDEKRTYSCKGGGDKVGGAGV